MARLGTHGERVVLVVNGEPVTLAAIEATRAALMTLGMGEEEAYGEAMRGQLRHMVPLQSVGFHSSHISELQTRESRMDCHRAW